MPLTRHRMAASNLQVRTPVVQCAIAEASVRHEDDGAEWTEETIEIRPFPGQ